MVALYASDTLYFWNTSREDCVKKLRLLPIKGQPEHLVVEPTAPLSGERIVNPECQGSCLMLRDAPLIDEL